MEKLYSVHRNVQILIALLKEHGVRHIVASAGTRNIPFVFSAQRDDYFHFYSVVDERSAAFFAIGIMQVTGEPAAVVCTSGTAAANYVSAANEAFYQHLPLVLITADRNHYYLNQQEDQCIPQQHLYMDVVRKRVDLPIVRDDEDAWYCGRLVNEALLEMNHREKGPVHINIQIDPRYPYPGGDWVINQKGLPKVTPIRRIMAEDPIEDWKSLSHEMAGRKILIVYGQNPPLCQEETDVINEFCDKYDVVFFTEHISNLHIKSSIHNATLINVFDWQDLCPDIIITMGGHRMADPKVALTKLKGKCQHWHVSPDGAISDVTKFQNTIVECHQGFFFKRMADLGEKCNHPYLDAVRSFESKKMVNTLNADDFDYSAVYAIKKLIENLPSESILHIANSDSIRIATYFEIPSSVKVYCNRGTCGIDGSMSSYIANSYMANCPSFLVIGDLSFFYDMNALWNKYINGNTRIMLINNGGGAILNWGPYLPVNIPGAQVSTGAEHNATAKGWAESRGFRYLTSKNKADFDDAFHDFMVAQSDVPIIFEVFTSMATDIEERNKIIPKYQSAKDQAILGVRNAIPKPVKNIVKNILGKQ